MDKPLYTNQLEQIIVKVDDINDIKRYKQMENKMIKLDGKFKTGDIKSLIKCTIFRLVGHFFYT